jgi:hypothetical protein
VGQLPACMSLLMLWEGSTSCVYKSQHDSRKHYQQFLHVPVESNFDKWDGNENTCKSPIYRILPLSVAHSTFETSQNAQKIPRI